MINLFKIADQDLSLKYLNQVFGNMYGVLGGASGPDITLLGTMFRIFNSIALTVGALILVYVIIVGVISTAHEGEFMGKKLNGIWTPIRIVLGIAALIPTSSGYCGLQIVMMWVIVQGIGAADVLWTTMVGYANTMGSPMAKGTVLSTAPRAALQNLFQGVVCDETARSGLPNPVNVATGGYYCAENKDTFCKGSPDLSDSSGSYSLGPGGSCGVLTYCNVKEKCASGTDTLECTACKAQVASLNKIVTEYRGIAQHFAQDIDYSYRTFYSKSWQGWDSSWDWIKKYCEKEVGSGKEDQCCIASSLAIPGVQAKCKGQPASNKSGTFPPPNRDSDTSSPSDEAVSKIYWPYGFEKLAKTADVANFINASVDEYVADMGAVMAEWMTSHMQQNASGGDINIDQGWILAGAYYYTLAKANNKNQQSANPVLTWKGGDPNQTVLKSYRNNFRAASVLMGLAKSAGQGQDESGMSDNQVIGQGGDVSSSGGSDADKALEDSMTPDSSNASPISPLLRIQQAGNAILAAVFAMFITLIAVTTLLAITGNLSVFVLGTGFDNPLGPALSTVYFLFVPMILGLMSILLAIGAFLGVYVPLIPYIIFAMGAVGWLLLTFEAMVAGPIVALGIMAPSNHHHEVLGKAEAAVMLLFNVFLRPSLMIFGLAAALLFASVVVSMIQTGFNIVRPTLGGHNPLTKIFLKIAYVYLIVSALNKVFGMISAVPEKTIRWIGGHGENMGEQEAVKETQQATSAGASELGSSAKGASDKTHAGAKHYGKSKADQEKREEERNKPASGPGVEVKKEDEK